VLMPLLRAPAEASAAAIGEVLAEATPLHRSPVALLRVGAVVAALLGALERALERLGARLAVAGAATAFADEAVGAEATGAEARGADAVAFAAGAGVRFVAPLLERRELTAPLVVAEAVESADELGAPAVLPEPGVADAVGPEADGAGAAGAVAGAGAAGTAVPPETATGGAAVAGGVGGAAGVAGVPKPAGVQAQAMPLETTATLSADKTDKQVMRARDCNISSQD
jgi:hypothetical protein